MFSARVRSSVISTANSRSFSTRSLKHIGRTLWNYGPRTAKCVPPAQVTSQPYIVTIPRRFYRGHHKPFNPPTSSFLGFLDKIPQNVVFYGIIGLNATVFAMWFLAKEKYKQEGDPSSLIWMQHNFTDSWQNLSSGRFWTPLTACFSHRDLSHIFFNGFTFFFLGQPVLQLLGSRQFMFLYLGGGLASSFGSLLYSKVAGQRHPNYASHGASGAIYSTLSFLACVAPTMTFQLYGIIPVPAWLAISGLFAYDLYSTVSNQTGTTDTVGHITGIGAGIAYFIIRRARIF